MITQPETIKPSSTFKLWRRRLLTEDTLTRGQIGQFGRSIAAGAAGYRIGGARTNLTPDECVNLMTLFRSRCSELDAGGFRLTKEHSEFGIQWLRDYPKNAERVGITPAMVETFRGFRFVGVELLTLDAWQAYASAFPIYRVLSDLPPVDYFWSPWQG